MTELTEQRWFTFDEAPAGSYACVWAPNSSLETAKISWMPAARGQVPPQGRIGLVCPLPELSDASLRARAALEGGKS